MTQRLTGALFARMIRSGAANLYHSRDEVNRLNVFPIPDGDTGDNMYMTVKAGTEVGDIPLGKAATDAAHGMLLGARGNSGVILSRIFAGIAKGFDTLEDADLSAVGAAFRLGVEEAYASVSHPVEGTILTVFREGVNAAVDASDAEGSVEAFFSRLIEECRASLERTPDLLPVLKEAGVIDSGGAGLLCILEGMRRALTGEEVAEEGTAPAGAHGVNLDGFGENDELKFGYCTEFLLRLTTAKVGEVGTFDESGMKDYLTSVGESVVFFREGSIIKVHVHTFTPGAILTEMQKYGEFLTLKIENMMLQHNEAAARPADVLPTAKAPRKKYATVTVAAGDGLRETFLALGADAVIDGGQSMNPAAGDFLAAFEKLNAEHILVFPNNKNIFLAASQAASMYEGAEVHVLESRTVGDGYAAISGLDLSGDTEEILENIRATMEATVTGEVSVAVRDTQMDGVQVRAGDYIGFSSGVILTDARDADAAVLSLAEELHAGSYDICLLLCGKDIKDATNVYNTLQSKYKRTEVIMIDGGQPIYDYILILE